ncbi:hypothetical protein N0V85_004987 [Neurospora sp. IMI 360204]|nr:hypothetical protein N0V85_004987 [Neurospora sp. IMI 360204]
MSRSLVGPRNIMVSGQSFSTVPYTHGIEWGLAFAFNHLGPHVDAAYKDRNSYKIEIIWSLNPIVNQLNQQLTKEDRQHPVWYSEAMNKRTEIPESKSRLLFAEGIAMNSALLGAFPGLRDERTVFALLPSGIPAPHLLETLSDKVKKDGVYFDCKVDVTHVPTGKVLLKDHILASGVNGVRVVSSDAPEAIAGKHLERPTDLVVNYFHKSLQLSDKQYMDWKLEQLSGSSGTQL